MPVIAVIRATRSELVKLRRTLALWVSVAVPLAALLMLGANIMTRGETATLPGSAPWVALLDNFTFFLWCRLAYPLLVTLVTALIAGIEHGENQWPRLFSLPTPRWSVYAAKLIVSGLVLALSSVVLAVGVALLGTVLNRIHPSLGLVGPIPWGMIASQVALVYLSSLLLLSVQMWLALRWASFALASGFGIAGTVVAIVLTFSRTGTPLTRVFPWSMVAAAVPTPSTSTTDPTVVLAVAVVGAIVVGGLGCWNVVSRDVV